MIIKNSLIRHPGTACNAVRSLNAEFEILPNGNLRLRYALTGDLPQLLIPDPLPAEMTDGLWKHTCFEAFIAATGNDHYHEFNFSPSGRWAAYAFSSYRVQSQWTIHQAPCIKFTRTDKHVLLEADIAAADLPPNHLNTPYQLGLSAVVETAEGLRSYWALHHPAPVPDFHHRGGFVQSFETATVDH